MTPKEITGANISLYKLAEEAGFGLHSDGEIYTAKLEHLPITENMEKFAELIIRECVKAVSFSYKNEDYDSEWDAALREAESNVKQHFGVE